MMYELLCIAMAVYWEARGEPVAGQIAVAQVVMNRVNDSRYPSDACSVVYDAQYYPWRSDVPIRNQCQFSFFCDGKPDQPTDGQAWYLSQVIAQIAWEGGTLEAVNAATHYHEITVHPAWANDGKVVATINNHVFYSLEE